MAYVEYTASREVMAGHSAETDYHIDFSPRSLNYALEGNKVTLRSLNGTSVTTEFSAKHSWEISSQPELRGSSAYNQWLEFLNSVRVGESFYFDPYGTYASPATIYTVVMEGYWTQERPDPIDYHIFTFRVIEA